MDVRRSDPGQCSWVKATASGTGNCVELARSRTDVLVRDSKDPDGARLSFAPPVFAALLAAARSGALDVLR